MTKKGKISVLFICLGNICRSPAANGVMLRLVEDHGLTDAIAVDSAGVGGWHIGQLPDERMRKHGRLRGYDFNHRARQFNARTDFNQFDYIVTMDEENYQNITDMARTADDRQKVVRMSTYFEKYRGQSTVPDPYYGGADGFELALDLIEDGCQQLLKYIVNKHNL